VDDVDLTVRTELELIYRASGDRLWWALLAYTGDGEVASDALAEAFALALSSQTALRDPAAWIWRVAFRVATAELRRARSQIHEIESEWEIDERAADVILALRGLSRNQRAVVVLHYLDDRSVKETADLLDMHPTTASVHLHRARRRLRMILGEGDD
jgi:RNA polymerase sigma-70 factor (ECF subfamily)